MSNMSYCRFRNTLGDLRDCLENIGDRDLSKDEAVARLALLRTCRAILEECGHDVEEPEGGVEGQFPPVEGMRR